MKLETLKTIFFADAATCTAVFLATTLATDWLAELLGTNGTTLIAGGIVCLGTALLLVWLATRSVPPLLLSWAVVIGNLGWVAASVATVQMTPSITPVGAAVILAQAAGVFGFAMLEAIGIRALGQRKTV